MHHFVEMYGADKAEIWYNRWKIFYLGSAEFFGYDGGEQFGTCHYLFEKPARELPENNLLGTQA